MNSFKPSGNKQTKLVVALSLLGCAGFASAAGFQLYYQNLSGLGNAYAGSAAVADNASTVFFNPAGMTQLKEREFSAGAAVITPSVNFTNSGSTAGPSTASGGDAGMTGYVPNAYITWALNKDLYVGLGFGAPFGSKSEYDQPWVGSAQANSFAIETINITPSIAYRVSDTVSVGGGVNYQKIDATYKRAAGIAGPFALSSVTAELGGDSWGWNAGALFTLSPATKVGVSYRSTVSYDTTGDITVTGPVGAINSAGTSGAKASLVLPDMLILSATHKLDNKWEVLGDVSWTGWSSLPKLDLIRTTATTTAPVGALAQSLVTDFRDTYRVAVGANYQYSKDLKLKMGLAYDQTPVKSEINRLVSLPDNDRTQLAAGAQWTLASRSTLDVGVSYLMVADASINNNQTTPLPTGSPSRGIVKGNYSGNNAWILGVQYSMPF
jgi:long-chain fatty acid transport protein